MIDSYKKAKQRVEKQTKFLRKAVGKRDANALLAHQTKFIQHNMLPPMVASVFNTINVFAEKLANNVNREFSESEKEQLLDYIETNVFDVLKDPSANDEKMNAMFVRIASLGYLTDALVDYLVEREVVEMTPDFVSKTRSLTASTLNLLTSIQERKRTTGKFGLSGSNHAEIREIVAMFKGLIDVCFVSEYYYAYMLVFNRLLFTRLGGKVEEMR